MQQSPQKLLPPCNLLAPAGGANPVATTADAFTGQKATDKSAVFGNELKSIREDVGGVVDDYRNRNPLKRANKKIDSGECVPSVMQQAVTAAFLQRCRCHECWSTPRAAAASTLGFCCDQGVDRCTKVLI